MKFLIAVFCVVFSQVSFAKNTLVDDCSHLKEASEAQFVLFNKQEFIELGECLAVYNIKNKQVNNLPMLCAEINEDINNPFGFMTLSKVEIIYIGQCLGTINYIFEHYNNEFLDGYNRYSNSRRSRRYVCEKGMDAVSLLTNNATDSMSRSDIRDVLCKEG